jgi:PAS domain S-box-containing protein
LQSEPPAHRARGRSRVHDAAAFAAVTCAYVAAGKLGLTLAFVHASATAVWPPTGIAIASLLLFGLRLWPAMLAGAFLVNVSNGGALPTSLGIAVGNTLEAIVAVMLTRRVAGGLEVFDRARNLFRFVFAAGILAAPISATIGVTSLVLGGEAVWSRYGSIWLTWWLGDVVGAVVVTPVLVLWARQPRITWRPRRAIEGALVVVAVIVTAILVFGGGAALSRHHFPVGFLCIPFCLWAAFRFGPREAATSVVVLAVIALWGTVHGFGPFAGGSDHRAIALLQVFVGVVSVTVLAVGTLVAERRTAERDVRQLNEVLEARVRERTALLESSNRELVSEIGERRRAEHERERSEARLLEAQGVAHIGSWEWDITADRVWWSDELYRIYGMSPGSTPDASYESFLGRVHEDDRVLVDGNIRRAAETGQPFSFDHRLILPDGTVKWVSARGQVVRDASGRAIRMLGTGQDITEWKRIERERSELSREQAARQEAEQANRLKDEFLATLSHELRTPLNAIIGWLQILNGRALDPSTRHTLDVIDRNAASLRRLIEDVLDVSAIVSGKLRLAPQPFDLRTAVQAAVDSIRPAAAARSIQLESRMSSKDLPVLGDAQRLQQAVTNVVANAVKFTPDGGRIRVEMIRLHDLAVLRVTDTGVGIAPDVLPHVFDRFRQGDSSVTRAHGGLGLGLAIVRHLVNLHGGTVHADSRGEGHGSTFTVRLPLIASEAADSAGGRPGILTAPPATLAGLHVLAVDDDADARELVVAGLSSAGALVTTAGSPEDAIRDAERAKPDLLVLDIAMPGHDGYTLLQELRARGIDVPAVALTAHVGREERRRALAAGFAEHVAKPFNLSHLTELLARLSREARLPSGAVTPRHDAKR